MTERLRFAPWSELRAAVPPEPPWVLEKCVASSTITMLAGKPKAGKSTLACAIAEAVDAGAPSFIGRRVTGGPVVYVSEEGAGTLAQKLSSSSGSTALTRDAAWPKPRWHDLIAAAVQEAERIRAVLLVIDALAFWAAFGEGQEKDAGSAQATMNALGAATTAGLAVLLVHHQRKAGGEGGDAVRGSGAIFGAVDVLLELERFEDAPSGHRRLVTIGRWSSAAGVLVIDRDSTNGSWRTVGQAESRSESAVMGYRERLLDALPDDSPGATEPEIAELIATDKRKVAGPLRELLADGRVAKSGDGVKGNPYRYWKCSPESSPTAGGESDSEFSPSPIGGENQNRILFLPDADTGEETGRINDEGLGAAQTLEDAILDPEDAEQIRASVNGEWREGQMGGAT